MKIKLTLLTLSVLFLSWAHISYAETIFIFNPEAKISKIAKAKSELENYLKSNGINSEVYIFANSDDFQNSVNRLNPDLAIIASYYYGTMKPAYLWKAILAGHKKGAKVFNKVLITLKSVNDPLKLRDKSLAAVSLGSSSSYIDSMLPSELSVKTLRIVSVSKDIDAIMALGFEQVQAAIVMKRSFDKLGTINPEVVRNLHVLQTLNSVPYPKIAVFPQAGNIEKFMTTFRNMPYTTSTKNILKFFDITGFDTER